MALRETENRGNCLEEVRTGFFMDKNYYDTTDQMLKKYCASDRHLRKQRGRLFLSRCFPALSCRVFFPCRCQLIFDCSDYGLSTTAVQPMPPPMQRVARPFFASRFFISCSRVTRIRQPDAPTG